MSLESREKAGKKEMRGSDGGGRRASEWSDWGASKGGGIARPPVDDGGRRAVTATLPNPGNGIGAVEEMGRRGSIRFCRGLGQTGADWGRLGVSPFGYYFSSCKWTLSVLVKRMTAYRLETLR